MTNYKIIEKNLKFSPIKLSKNNVYGEEAFHSFQRSTFEKTIKSALLLKNKLGVNWKYEPGRFPQNFQNYVKGWNSTEEELKNNADNSKLYFINLDLDDNGCTRRCSHCFTMKGQIDLERGRKSQGAYFPKLKKKLEKKRLLEQIKIAKEELGLKSIRLLGRGEPTESPYLLEFVETISDLGLSTVLFTRGHVIGNDSHAKLVYNKYGIKGGYELAERLFQNNVSVIQGFSALNNVVHDGMTGIEGHSKYSEIGLQRFLELGFNKGNPTRIGIEAPIAKINMDEFPISYVFFQCMGISPIYNSYMVTGRADEKFFNSNTPSLKERIKLHSKIMHFMMRMGIGNEVGAYLGTKECHDVEHGLYIPSTGDVRPCTGYESKESIKGDLNKEDIRLIWENSRIKGRQHICPPKINHGFPNNYINLLNEELTNNKTTFEDEFQRIINGLGFNCS